MPRPEPEGVKKLIADARKRQAERRDAKVVRDYLKSIGANVDGPVKIRPDEQGGTRGGQRENTR